MGSLSLSEILDVGSLLDSKVLVGMDQLDRLVTGVTVGEVPDIARWLTGGELVLSTFFAVSGDRKALRDFITEIINGPAAALAVKPARFVESIPPEILRLAHELEFPIIEVPGGTRWTSIIADIYAAMSKAQDAEDLLDDVAAGLISVEKLNARLAALGADLSEGYNVLTCSFEPEERLGRFQREVARIIGNEDKRSLIVRNSKGVVAAVPAGQGPSGHGRIKQLAEKLLVVGVDASGQSCVGVSRRHGSSESMLDALNEAQVALECGFLRKGSKQLIGYDDLGVYRLLLPLAKERGDDGRLFFDETVGKLVEYDRRHGTNLVETLEVFKANDENIALAAEALFAHRHTVRYRLQRISEISGCDPFNSVEREKLYMGLHVGRLMGL